MGTARADDPVPEMRAVHRASNVAVTLYQVKPNVDGDFLTALNKSGAYNLVGSSFGGEKTIEVIHGSSGAGAAYLVISRYHSADSIGDIQKRRQAAVQSYLAAQPVTVTGNLADAAVADWTWEHDKRQKRSARASQSVLSARPIVDDHNVFGQYAASLNFMKIGYVGQTASVEFFSAARTASEIRSAISARPGLTGTMIVALGGGRGWVAYSEYYEAPASVGQVSLAVLGDQLSGGASGLVVDNYMGR